MSGWQAGAQAAKGAAAGVMEYEAAWDRYKQEAQNYGTHVGAVKFETESRLRNLPKQAVAISEGAEASKLQVEQERARTVSELTVQAAAAGVAGQSVDAVVTDTMLTADTVLNSIDNQETSQLMQVSQDAQDIIVEGEKAKGKMQLGNEPNIWASMLGGIFGAF